MRTTPKQMDTQLQRLNHHINIHQRPPNLVIEPFECKERQCDVGRDHDENPQDPRERGDGFKQHIEDITVGTDVSSKDIAV